jgi:hypothetical protein
LVSLESLFATMEDLTAIQPYSGWRNSASEGESEALDYVAGRLDELDYLNSLGLEMERQTFHVFLGTELRETRLHLTVDGREIEVPADGLRGPRDDVGQALRFDSDGALNDATPDPVLVEGSTVLVRSPEEIDALSASDVKGQVVFLDYSAIDRITQGGMDNAVGVAWDLIAKEPAGLVLVTSFSNTVGESHGTFVGDGSALNWVGTETAPPVLYVRLEDLAVAGIAHWIDLERVERARLTWDADISSPATSGNLAARIPGQDPSRTIILGAHIDSPNAPGAMDDGSGSAMLLEVARVLDAAGLRPPTDVHLVWFGSEELGLYGSAHFVATHQELLDRTQAMLQIDMLSRPLDSIEADINLVGWSYGQLGDTRLLWPDHLSQASSAHGITTAPEDIPQLYSDNSSFGGLDVPHADLIYVNEEVMEATGSVHYAAHIHDPYDTVELAREMGDVLEDMTRVALTAVLEPPEDVAALRITAKPDRRVLFVASHTEPVHMTPAMLTDLGMTLAWEGFDVDIVPYGQPVTSSDLEDTDLVVVLPVLDYPSPETDPGLYDEEWSEEEISILETYAADGGLLVLSNSANRLKYGNLVMDANEDWSDVNDLSQRFGVQHQEGTLTANQAMIIGQHPLVDGLRYLDLAENNSVPFTLGDSVEANILAEADGGMVVVLVDHGRGQVLILGDVGILGADWGGPDNLSFWQNLARYARR